MERHLDTEIESLRSRLIRMGGLVEQMIAEAIRALLERDVTLVPQTCQREAAISDLEEQVEEQGLAVIALHQPVAGDLRTVTACMMISQDLDRMADLARNISLYSARLDRHLAGSDSLVDVGPMARATQQSVRDAINCFVRRDAALARDIIERDDTIDNFNDQLSRELREAMTQNSSNVEPGFAMILVIRALERIGDHATSIANDVIQCVEGFGSRSRNGRLEHGDRASHAA